jgi:hypothetical protein
MLLHSNIGINMKQLIIGLCKNTNIEDDLSMKIQICKDNISYLSFTNTFKSLYSSAI